MNWSKKHMKHHYYKFCVTENITMHYISFFKENMREWRLYK